MIPGHRHDRVGRNPEVSAAEDQIVGRQHQENTHRHRVIIAGDDGRSGHGVNAAAFFARNTEGTVHCQIGQTGLAAAANLRATQQLEMARRMLDDAGCTVSEIGCLLGYGIQRTSGASSSA